MFALTTYDVVKRSISCPHGVVGAVMFNNLFSTIKYGLLTDFICFKADAPTVIAARPLHSRNRDNLLMQHGRERPGNACP